LMATLLHYIKDEAEQKIPIWRMIAAPLDGLRERAEAWCQALGTGEVITGESTIGGGSLPGETLPTFLFAVPARSPDRLAERLRQGQPAVIARVQAERLVLDPRSVLPEQDDRLIEALRAAIQRAPII
jgi:L-seryl-tRNA(Ser) seleniumtransferase